MYNVNNNCATGSTALFMAKQFVEGGLAECTMALGFEKMEKGSLGSKYTDRTNPMDKHFGLMVELRDFAPAPPAPQMFGKWKLGRLVAVCSRLTHSLPPLLPPLPRRQRRARAPGEVRHHG